VSFNETHHQLFDRVSILTYVRI